MNPLVPDAAAQTAELTREVEGRHTTTTARRYRLPSGPESQSAVIDAPGVRDFAPPATLARAAERGFVEIHERAADCRFSDCRHLEEPQCAVRNAVLAHQISARRYESYRRLLPAVREARLGNAGASGERVRECAAVDVLELPADRHAVRDARGLEPARRASSPR